MFEKVVGYVGHVNISVPTSLYMYASFGIPVIGLNMEPIASIINQYRIGVTISSMNEFPEAYNDVLKRYNEFSSSCSRFLEQNNWSDSASIHREFLEVI